MELTPILTDALTRRKQIRAKALAGLTKAFPLVLRDRTIELHDPVVVERDFGPNDQKQALLEGSSLHEPIRGTLVMKNLEGKEIERVKNFTLLNLPYFTERHTFVIDGNEYQVSNQIRTKPGVYTRKRANEELETSFNLSKGSNFRISLDPKKGHPYMEYATTTIPLYPVLRRLGVAHEDIAKSWGRGTAEENQRSFIGKEEQAIEKLYGKLIHPAKQVQGTIDEKVAAIHAAYAQTTMDPEVNQVTLGHAHATVTTQAILDGSHKLLAVYKSGEDGDDRDSLAFKTFHSVDDFVKERIGLDARTLNMKTKGRAVNKTTIREIMPSSPFSAGLKTFLTGSKLSAIPTQINPMELIDHAVAVTSLGEGGIASERAIPMEARQLHSTHLGILDPVRTPEAFTAGVVLRTGFLTHRDEHGNLYTPVKDLRTGKFEYLSAKEMARTVLAFPGQKLTGPGIPASHKVDAMKDGQVQHVPVSEVKHELYHAAQLYSPTSNLIPMMESIQGNRATMGSKMQTQALPLVDRQVPWVQVGARKLFGGGKDELSSFEKELGKLVVPCAPQAGKVVKIDSQYIYIDPTGKMKHAEEMTKVAVVLMHVSGPSGSGKSTLLEQISQQHPGVVTQDLDQFDDEASEALFPGARKQEYSNEMLHSLAQRRQQLMDAFLAQHEGTPVVLGGHHTEGDTELKIPTDKRYQLNTGAATSAWRAYRRSQSERPDHQRYFTDLPKDYREARDTEKELTGLGYQPMAPDQIHGELARLLKTSGEPKRQTTIKGIKMKVELEKGDIRRGVNKETGAPWEKEMHAAYGHIPKTRGHDGETVDIYLKEPGFFGEVYCVKQIKKDGTHDEDKLMVGFSSCEEAIECYKKHVPKWCFGSMQTLSWSEFEDYVDDYWHEKAASSKDLDESHLIKVPYDTDFPFASKTYINHNVVVKVGDHVKEDQHLADSNFTRNGVLALGRNMKTAYMAYYGLNSNDAVVISEGAAAKLTSEHMYKEVLDIDPDMTLRRELHRLYYGAKYTAETYRQLDAEGVVKKGQKVMPHDILIAGVRKTKMSAQDVLLGNLKKSLANPYREEVRTWDHDFEGEVIDVYKADKRVVVTVKTKEPMRIGDKLSGRVGNKGVISHIVPDAKMIQDESGKPIDILYTSAGVISRINPSQILETAIAKVAEKTGKPVIMENFTGRDNVQYAKALLKEHGVKDKETVFDPISGKHIPGVLVGPQYTLRLFKTTDSNYSARGTGAYDVNQQPGKGGDTGAKGIGAMEFGALVAHNARNVLRETSVLKSQKNDEFWRAAQLGLPLPPLKSSFAYNKFEHMIQAAGIRLEKKGNTATLRPMTDNDVMKLSQGEVQNEKLVKAKNLEPERGGLFDPAVTGGPSGTKWSHVELAEPLLNPVFHEPTRRLLGLTNKALDELHAKEGGAALKTKLNAIDVVTRLAQLRAQVKTVSPSKLDDLIKQIKVLEALKAAGLRPGDAYVVSKLAVLPPIMRPILPGASGGELVVGDSNYLYQAAILHNNALLAQVRDRTLPPDEHAVLRQNLFNAVGAVVGTNDSDNPKLQKRNVKGFIEHLTGKTNPKSSYFQQKLYKRQQDFSGRGTIAPDGSLGIDEIGLPEEMMWSMFSKFVLARLVRRGFNAVEASAMMLKRHPAARDALMAEIAERPVMVNRAPSLHRFNLVGAYAVPTPGKTIRVNPFIEKGMNADYDGDQQIGAVLLQIKNTDFDSLGEAWQNPVWRRMRQVGENMAARLREIVGYQVGADLFWCDLSEFPHLPVGTVQEHVTAYGVPPGVKIIAFAEATGTLSFQTPTQWSVHKDRVVETVTLSSGRQLITDDDPRAVYGVDPRTLEFKRARPRHSIGLFVPIGHDLQLIDGGESCTEIAVPRTGDETRTRDTVLLDERFGRLCGTIAGDGWVSPNKQVSLAAADESIVAGYRADLRCLFIDPPILCKTERMGGDFGDHVRSCRWVVSAKAYAELMLPLVGSGAHHKHLPPFFLGAPRDFRVGLLAGLMDTDGSIAVSHGKAKPQWMVNFSTVSIRLARELVLLCKTLAVRASITSTKTPLGAQSWIVSLSTPHLHKLGALPVSSAKKYERFSLFFKGESPGGGATNAKDVIPTSPAVARKLMRLYKQSSEYVMLYRAIKCGYITRVLALKILAAFPQTAEDPELRTWFFFVHNPAVRWDRVVSYDKTEMTETGYDLSVPGSETFMSVDGVILSNTFQVHAPVLTAAANEVKQMTLSNLIFGDRSKDDLMVAPAMEAVLGLALATALVKPGGKVHKFKTKADAMAAYHRGEITLQDNVEIK